MGWRDGHGGRTGSTRRWRTSPQSGYDCAESSDCARPFVADSAARSNSVVTVDLDQDVDASKGVGTLASNGIRDTAGYRKLGRNQLRIGVFPSVDPEDVKALTGCIDYVVERL